MINKKPSKLTKLKRLSTRAQTDAKGEHRPKSRDPKYPDQTKRRTPSLPPLPWKD